MKVKLSFFLIFLAFCTNCKFVVPVDPPRENPSGNLKIQKVVETLQSQPDWLYPANDCPVDVMPKIERSVNDLGEACADEPKKCLENCQINDGGACYSLALFLQQNYTLKADYIEALFLRSCKLGIVSGCTNTAAGFFSFDLKDQQKLKCAADTFEKTCLLDDPWGCTMYGMILSSGVGREKNLDEAKKYFTKACDTFGEEDQACQQAQKLLKQINSTK